MHFELQTRYANAGYSGVELRREEPLLKMNFNPDTQSNTLLFLLGRPPLREYSALRLGTHSHSDMFALVWLVSNESLFYYESTFINLSIHFPASPMLTYSRLHSPIVLTARQVLTATRNAIVEVTRAKLTTIVAPTVLLVLNLKQVLRLER